MIKKTPPPSSLLRPGRLTLFSLLQCFECVHPKNEWIWLKLEKTSGQTEVETLVQ